MAHRRPRECESNVSFTRIQCGRVKGHPVLLCCLQTHRLVLLVSEWSRALSNWSRTLTDEHSDEPEWKLQLSGLQQQNSKI